MPAHKDHQPEQALLKESDLNLLPISELDRMAFGVTSGDRIEVSPDELHIAYPGDLENPRHAYAMGGDAWLKSVSLEEPIEVSIDQQGRKVLENGHHRYLAASLLGKKLQAIVDVKGNPIRFLLSRQKLRSIQRDMAEASL